MSDSLLTKYFWSGTSTWLLVSLKGSASVCLAFYPRFDSSIWVFGRLPT
jgi:hypothetical protein